VSEGQGSEVVKGVAPRCLGPVDDAKPLRRFASSSLTAVRLRPQTAGPRPGCARRRRRFVDGSAASRQRLRPPGPDLITNDAGDLLSIGAPMGTSARFWSLLRFG